MSTRRGIRRPRPPRRRDRRGRGLRGPLFPATLPAAASRSEQFDALVVDALEPIEARVRGKLSDLDVAVDEVPEVVSERFQSGLLFDGDVPLARLVPVGIDRDGEPTRARIVLYRRPLETRAKGPEDLADLLHDVLVEQIAVYLDVDPETLD